MLRVALETIAHRSLLNVREVARLGRHPWYWRLKSALAAQELVQPAWRVAQREGAESGLSADDLTYGETPILTAWELLKQLGAGPQDTVVDLGCGRGQVLAVAAVAFGCAGVGLEALPGLARQAEAVSHARIIRADFREHELPQGTLYFLSPTALEQASWEALQQKMGSAPVGARAVCLSIALPGWEVLDQRQRAYSWGNCTVYLQRKTK